MTAKKPLVSVITPVFNRAELIRMTIESLLSQTYSNWELLVVDDDSTDNTAEVVNMYSQKDKRVKYWHRNSNVKGANACRNTGLQLATGKYALFLDSDDRLCTFCLEQRVGIAESYSKYDGWIFPGIRTFLDGRENEPDNYLISAYKGETDPLESFVTHDFLWQTSGPLYKRKSLIEKKLYFHEDIQILQDVLFHIQALVRKLSFYVVTEKVSPDYFWYVHTKGNTGTKVNISHLTSNLLYIDLVIEELKSAALYKEKYDLFFLDFLLKDLARYGTYPGNKENIEKVLRKIKDLGLLPEKEIQILMRFCFFACILPFPVLRRKIITFYRVRRIEKLPPNKYFLTKHLKEIV